MLRRFVVARRARWSRPTVVVPVALAALAACGGPLPEDEPRTVVVRERLGERDRVEFLLERDADAAQLERRIRSAAKRAGLRDGGIERDEHEDELLELELTTTLGEDVGFLRRRIQARTLRELAVFGGDRLLLRLPRAALIVEGDAEEVSADFLTRRVRARGEVVYMVPGWRVALALSLLLLLAVLPFGLLRPYAARVSRRDVEPVERVHRLRVALFGAMLAPVLILPLLGLFGGLFLLPDALLGELAPGVSRLSGAGFAGIFLVGILPFTAAFVGAYLGVRPYYRDLRGIEQRIPGGRARAMRGVFFLLLPLVAWLVVRIGVGKSLTGLPAIAVYVVLFLALLALGPLALVKALGGRVPEAETRDRLLEMGRRHGLKVRDVRLIEMPSEKMANAGIAGVFPQLRYLIVSDELLQRFEDDELEAVIAHEAAHGKHHHVLFKLLALLGFWGLWVGVLLLVGALVRRIDPLVIVFTLPAVLPIGLILSQGLLGLLLERKADDYAAERVGDEPMRRALEKLAEINMVKRRTGRFFNLLSQHPGIEQRVERLRARTGSKGRVPEDR